MCDCYCESKNLYKNYKKEYSLVNGQKFDCQRDISNFYNPHKSNKFVKLFEDTLDMGAITYPTLFIEEIEFQEIVDNPLFFYKEFISQNKPCKILNAVNNWEALEKWQDINYLKQKMGSNNITVDITPDGFADSVHGKYFAQPYQQKMKFQEFLNIEEKYDLNNYVPYIQKQNGNLTSEFSFLQEDINPFLQEFGTQNFFDTQPEAINYWLGHDKSVSSMHKDHYENFYSVITGEKHFTLMPPETYPYQGHYNFINGYWEFDENKQEFQLNTNINQNNQDNNNNQEITFWNGINIDLQEDRQQFPFLQDLPQYHVIIKPGEVLYLPALWFHQVSQAKCKQSEANHNYIQAVNFWYDMKFDQKYRCLQMLENLVKMDSNLV